MDTGYTKHLRGMLATGHKHAEMSQMLSCNFCGRKFKEAEALHNRLKREHPELFAHERPEFQPSQELRNMFGKLVDRVQNDSLYRKHLELSLHGTEAEKERETERANSGYYTRHTGEPIRKTL